MKATIKSIIAIAAIAILAISCQKEDVLPIPGAITKEVKAGDTPTLSFTVSGDWHLTSDQIWCKFVTSSGELQEMSGGTGQHTITLKITDDNNGNQWSTAKITMKNNGQQGIIATIKRHPKELYIKLYDITDTPTKSFILGYVDWVTTRIEGNFHYAATEIPDWVEVAVKHENGTIEITNSITGIPGEQTEVLLRIVNDGERETKEIKADDGYVITFSDESGETTIQHPITYAGMGIDKLSFTGPTDYYFGWEVSLDGKTFRQSNPENGTIVTFHDALQYNIIAQNSEYHIIYFEKSIERGIPSYTLYDHTGGQRCWMDFNKTDMVLTVDDNEDSGSPRYGGVIALHKKKYSLIRASLEESILTTDSSSGIELECIDDEYIQYTLIELTQHDLAEAGEYEGMEAYHSLTALDIYCDPYTNPSLTEKYGCEDIYRCDFVNSVEGKNPGIIINPRVENWDTMNHEAGNASVEVYHGENQLKISEGEYYIGENKDELLSVHLWGPKGGWNDTDVHILFKVGGQTKKVLVVTPPTH